MTDDDLRKMFDALIAEVRRLRADNAALIGSVQVYMKTAMATNEQLNAVMAERDELRACLRIAMKVWSDLYEEHRGSRSPKIEDDDDWQRCRRAMVES